MCELMSLVLSTGNVFPPVFDCGLQVEIPISGLCNGTDDCEGGARAGDDETAVFCDSKLK